MSIKFPLFPENSTGYATEEDLTEHADDCPNVDALDKRITALENSGGASPGVDEETVRDIIGPIIKSEIFTKRNSVITSPANYSMALNGNTTEKYTLYWSQLPPNGLNPVQPEDYVVQKSALYSGDAIDLLIDSPDIVADLLESYGVATVDELRKLLDFTTHQLSFDETRIQNGIRILLVPYGTPVDSTMLSKCIIQKDISSIADIDYLLRDKDNAYPSGYDHLARMSDIPESQGLTQEQTDMLNNAVPYVDNAHIATKAWGEFRATDKWGIPYPVVTIGPNDHTINLTDVKVGDDLSGATIHFNGNNLPLQLAPGAPLSYFQWVIETQVGVGICINVAWDHNVIYDQSNVDIYNTPSGTDLTVANWITDTFTFPDGALVTNLRDLGGNRQSWNDVLEAMDPNGWLPSMATVDVHFPSTLVGNKDHNILLKGNDPRPFYNNEEIALLSDIHPEIAYTTETTLYETNVQIPHVQGPDGDIPVAPLEELVLHAQNDQGYWAFTQETRNLLTSTQALNSKLQGQIQDLLNRVAVLEDTPPPDPEPVYDMATGLTLHTPALLGLLGITIGGVDNIGTGWTAPSDGLLVVDGASTIGLLTPVWVAVNGTKADPSGTVLLQLLGDGSNGEIEIKQNDVVTQSGMGNITFYKRVS